MVCAVGDEKGRIRERRVIPTRTPKETLPEMIGFYREQGVESLGIGCFGPINPVKGTRGYGFITSTPKLAWQNCDIAGAFERALGCPVGFDTDVNASLLGEITFGAARGLSDCIYVTVGTGIGVGVCAGGKLLHGVMHPEAGHILMRRRPGDSYPGKCPFHASCLEGLAAGPAIEERWGAKGAELKDRREVWDLEAYYLAQACVDFTYVYSPGRIILGGGVMHQEQLFPMIRRQYRELEAGYVKNPQTADLESYIVPASLGDDQGILGCLRLAWEAKEG